MTMVDKVLIMNGVRYMYFAFDMCFLENDENVFWALES